MTDEVFLSEEMSEVPKGCKERESDSASLPAISPTEDPRKSNSPAATGNNENKVEADVSENKIKYEDDTKLKQSDSGTLLSRGGEFGADEITSVSLGLGDVALNDLQTTSDIRFFICGSCKNNPILIGSTPKLLPCLHSFCENCLKERYEKQKQSSKDGLNTQPRLKCPSCGQEFLVAANDKPTSGFLNNQFVIESTPARGTQEPENHQCTSCDDKSSADSYCLNCNEWLCSVCVSAHQRVKVTKDHIIQSKSTRSDPKPETTDIPPNPNKEKPLFCKMHTQEQLRLFCANCDKLTCRDCQLVEHKDHRYQFINEAATKHRDTLKKLLQYLQINLGLLKETIVDVEKVSDGLSDQEKELEGEIKNAFDSLINSIKVRQENLVKELKQLVVSKQSLLAKQKKDLTQMRIILEHNHDFAEFAVKGGSNVALLYSRKVLGTRLHNLNSLKYRQRPLAFTDLKFSMDVDKLCSYFSKIGAVYSHEDMQRRIDHYNTKTPPSSIAPRTMALSSRSYNNKVHQSPIESMTAINKRISESTAVTSSTAYINLSKQGSFGLPGHQTLRTSVSSPNYNSARLSSTISQDMIELSSSHPRSFQNADPVSQIKRDMASKYRKASQDWGGGVPHKSHIYDKNKHVPSSYDHRASHVSYNGRDYHRKISLTSPHREHHSNNQNKIEQPHHSKNSTIDQLQKMVTNTLGSGISSYDGMERPSPRASVSDVQTGRLSANGMVIVKEENKSPDVGTYQMSLPHNPDDRQNDAAFDEGQSNEDYCGVCRNGGQLLCCDTCPKVYHLNCHVPALTGLPSDSWSCGLCADIGNDTRPGHKRRYTEQLTDWERKLTEKIILSLFVHADSLPFHHKVSKVQVPDYYKVITKPMDLMTVLTKLNPQHFEAYKTFEDFISDIRLVFSNCFIYNSAESDVCKMGRRLEAHFDALLKKHAPDANAYPSNEPRIKRRKEDNSLA